MIATKTIPLMVPFITDGQRAAVQEVLSSRYIGQGPRVDEFERRFSEQIAGGLACVATGSGTDALHLAYMLAGVGPGDEVIAPIFTCTATNIPFLYWGMIKRRWWEFWKPKDRPAVTVKFCDVSPDSLNMDPAHCKSLLSERTKAIVVVNYGGAPVDDELFGFGPPVIEDCAQSLGGTFPIRGDYACFSFQAVKHIGTGDGGMLVLPEEQVELAKRLRWFGIDRAAKLKGTWENDITEVGRKYQCNDIAAAMAIEGLDSLDYQMAHRRDLRDAYINWLDGIPGISIIDRDPDSACWLMTVLVERRDDFRKKLLSEGIESDQTHYRNDRYTIFKDHAKYSLSRERPIRAFPNMDAIDGKYLVIPLHMGMTVEDVQHICRVIRSGW